MIDLDLHTTSSDGQFDPATLLRLVWQAGLGTVAINDNDTAAAIAEARRVAQEYGVHLTRCDV